MLIRLQKNLVDALLARRIQKLSLIDSYDLALEASKTFGTNDESFLRLQNITRKILISLENDGANLERLNLEPAYHNRQHIADAVLSMGYFLAELTTFDSYEKQLLLLVMLVHDFGHKGIANKSLGITHEEETIALLRKTPVSQLPPEDIFFIEECISGTSPKNTSHVSEEFINNPEDAFSLMRALVNDADIAPSFIDPIGLELSRLILIEQGLEGSNEQEIDAAWNRFLKHSKIVTPAARKALGLPGLH